MTLTLVKTDKLCIGCGRPVAFGPQINRTKRCAACALAVGHWSPWVGLKHKGEQIIPVDCWCQRTTVWVRVADNRRGLTGTCGLDICRRAA